MRAAILTRLACSALCRSHCYHLHQVPIILRPGYRQESTNASVKKGSGGYGIIIASCTTWRAVTIATRLQCTRRGSVPYVVHSD